MTDMVSLPREDFKSLLEEAAEEGAKRAIANIGLTHQEILEIKDFFDAWKAAKNVAAAGAREFFTSGIKLAGKVLGGAFILWVAYRSGINISQISSLTEGH